MTTRFRSFVFLVVRGEEGEGVAYKQAALH
jgi:hypothetical protein